MNKDLFTLSTRISRREFIIRSYMSSFSKDVIKKTINVEANKVSLCIKLRSFCHCQVKGIVGVIEDVCHESGRVSILEFEVESLNFLFNAIFNIIQL